MRYATNTLRGPSHVSLPDIAFAHDYADSACHRLLSIA